MASRHPETPSARLSDLAPGRTAVIAGVEAIGADDPVAPRLEDLGFVRGEPLRVIAHGPLGGDPIVVQVGYTRFALRRAEAGRILVTDHLAAMP
ncbi:MAG: ferrous iron transport protein A [Gammaproteobacteria bacterium]